ncbi:MAG: dockerin type I repeat-containing protein [Clostridiales bacterium]|nr:dockerin type I repeat-containing protein [Clostridiales bacterium]
MDYSGSNVEAQDYDTYTSPVESYLTQCSDGSLMRFQATDDGFYLVEYYDTDYNLLDVRYIDEELPIFGGFYAADGAYFVLSGQRNKEESASVEVFRITKYDTDWNRLTSDGLSDCNTTVPFDAGAARMDVCGNYLIIRTSHEMYAIGGINHQANVTIELDMNTGKITDSFTGILNENYGYASHSFNQFIKMDGSSIVAVDHGDANPRSIVLTKYVTDASTGSFTPGWSTQYKTLDLFEIPGEEGDNYTGASVGGFEISGSAYLTVGNKTDYDNYESSNTRNVFVSVASKDLSSSKLIMLTDYAEGEESAGTPQLVKINDNRFMVLWSRAKMTYYTVIDGSGNRIATNSSSSDGSFVLDGNLSDCQPIVVNGKVIWYTCSDGKNTFYEIDANNVEKTDKTVVDNGHSYEVTQIDGYDFVCECTKCGDTKEYTVPYPFYTLWQDPENEYHYSSNPQSFYTAGTVLKFFYDYPGTIPEGKELSMDFEITSSDPSVVAVYDDYIRILKEGTAVITVTHKYVTSVSRTYTFNVVGSADEPATEATTESVTEATTEQITEPITEATTEKITEPETEATTEKITEPETEATTEKITEPTTEETTVEETVPSSGSSMLIGDVNLDGNISVADATAIQKFVVGTQAFSEEQFALADVNGDGSVTVADATTVQKMVVGTA